MSRKVPNGGSKPLRASCSVGIQRTGGQTDLVSPRLAPLPAPRGPFLTPVRGSMSNFFLDRSRQSRVARGPADVRGPVSLLLNRELAASAKLIWMLLRSGGPDGPSRLAVGSRLSRGTTGTGLDHLLSSLSAGTGLGPPTGRNRTFLHTLWLPDVQKSPKRWVQASPCQLFGPYSAERRPDRPCFAPFGPTAGSSGTFPYTCPRLNVQFFPKPKQAVPSSAPKWISLTDGKECGDGVGGRAGSGLASAQP